MKFHENYIKYKFLSSIHKDYIRSIRFNRANNSIISASSENRNPLKISYIDKTHQEYNFNLDKVTSLVFINLITFFDTFSELEAEYHGLLKSSNRTNA